MVLEGTTANDLGDTPDAFKVCRPGQGPCVSFMDNSSIADRGLFKLALEAGKAEGVPCQIKKYVAGGNDAGAIQRAGAGVKTVVHLRALPQHPQPVFGLPPEATWTTR